MKLGPGGEGQLSFWNTSFQEILRFIWLSCLAEQKLEKTESVSSPTQLVLPHAICLRKQGVRGHLGG